MSSEKINASLIDEALKILLRELVSQAIALRPQLTTYLQETQAMYLTIGQGQLYDQAYRLFRQALRQEMALPDIHISDKDLPF